MVLECAGLLSEPVSPPIPCGATWTRSDPSLVLNRRISLPRRPLLMHVGSSVDLVLDSWVMDLVEPVVKVA